MHNFIYNSKRFKKCKNCNFGEILQRIAEKFHFYAKPRGW